MLCKRCWNYGRNLVVGCCLCSKDAYSNTAFHAWNATRRIPYDIPQPKSETRKMIASRPKLVFGQAITK